MLIIMGLYNSVVFSEIYNNMKCAHHQKLCSCSQMLCFCWYCEFWNVYRAL